MTTNNNKKIKKDGWQWVVYDENNEPSYFTDKDKAVQHWHKAMDKIPDFNEWCGVLEYKRLPSIVKIWKRNSVPDSIYMNKKN